MPRSAASRPDEESVALAHEIGRSLTRTPRQLPSHYLYDGLGSSLFEAICRLPWYRIAVVEQRLLDTHAERIFAEMRPVTSVVELGPGSGEKLATLISARSVRNVTVHLVDVSAEALEQASRTLGALPDLSVVTHQATYEAGLASVGRHDGSGSSLVVFLGSNIGNFDPESADALLLAIRAAVRRGDSLLLGADLVKPEPELLLAYDDPLGVTAAFNRNLLIRINRELGGDFDLSAFAHRAVWDPEHQRIEMHLVSLSDQIVRIPAADSTVSFASNEWIWTESSYKYTADQIVDMGAEASFACRDQWVDGDAGFALTLFTAL